MIIYSNTYSYSPPIFAPQTGSQNPQEYYENEANHGEYRYVSLLDLTNNFMDNQTGDDTLT